MPRLNFNITKEQHRQLKTLASYSGINMKEFVLSRVFTEAAETVFTPRKEADVKNDELHKAQNLFFKKAEVIALSPEKWSAFRDRVKTTKRKSSD